MMERFVAVGIVLGALSSHAEAFRSSSSLALPWSFTLAPHHRNDQCSQRQTCSPPRWHISIMARSDDDGVGLEEDTDETSTTKWAGHTTTEPEASVSLNEDEESDMYQAVEEEDSTNAACRAELDKLHVDKCSSVLQANSNFYRAFSEKDLGAMEELWLRDSSVVCIHSSHNPISGTSAVLESWKTMFNSADATFKRNMMEPTNIRISVRGTTAVVTCDEEVYTRRFVRSRRRRTELANKLIATNVFRKVNGRWYIVYHHASWHASSPVALRALGSPDGEPLVPEKRPTLAFSEDDSEVAMRRRIQMRSRQVNRLQGQYRDAMSDREDVGSDDGSGKSDPAPLTLDGVLGIPPQDALSNKKKLHLKKSDEEGEPLKRLLGGLDDLLNRAIGGSDENDEDGGFIFENEDDEDDEFVGAPKIIIRTFKNPSSETTPQSSLISGGKIVPPIFAQAEIPQPASSESSKEAVRQNCIVALRSLASRGAITQKQKRILLTDIIMSSAKGESSVIEVAYGLLCGEEGGNDKDVAENEFADQCRVFAKSLSAVQQPRPSST